MKQLPASPDLSHLKKQAKHLLRDAAAGDRDAVDRFVLALPVARNIDLATYEPRLRDAQSVIAREYGFLSWVELKRYVEWKRTDTSARLKRWLEWCFEGNPRERRLARRMVEEEPELFARDPWYGCILGDDARVAQALADDPGFASRPGGPVGMPPLVAITHSRLIVDGGEEGYLACARMLIDHGADVDGSWIDPRFPEYPLSALYGAAGRSHNVALTKLLLDAGANPDDNESLYHSVETSDATCTRLLLAKGARVNGTNALGRVLDFDRLEVLKLLLAHGGDPNERPWMHHAILRGRSLDHTKAMLDAGADPRAKGDDGTSLYEHAALFGRTDITWLLEDLGFMGDDEMQAGVAFVAVCSHGNLAAAQGIKEREPDILARLTPRQLQLLPDLAAIGRIEGVRTMIAVGWPLEVKSVWDALNLSIFQGDAEMVRLLLDGGADWRTIHGFGDNALGTLSFASQAEEVAAPAPRDYAGCARALIDHGVPRSAFDKYAFSEAVADYLATVG